MTDKRTVRNISGLCAVAVFSVLLIAIPAVCFDFYYDLNDDTLIKDVISGAYSGAPSGYCVQLLYPLSWLISLIYRAVPDFAWYGLFLCVCQFGAAVLIACRLASLFKSVKQRVFALLIELLVLFGLFFREIVILQYSVTAGFCMVGAIFWVATSPQKGKRGESIPWVFLTLLAFSIRTEVCLMLSPFLLMAIFFKAAQGKIFTRANFKGYVLPLCAVAVGGLALFCLDMIAYCGEWSSFRSFFDARTTLYDFYGIPDYDENIEFYESVGLSRESYELLENYNFALDDSIDTWLLEAIADYQRGKLENTLGYASRNNLREALWLYKDKLFGEIDADTAAIAAAYLIYIIACLAPAAKNGELFNRAGRTFLQVAVLLVIRSALWLYLYMVDRAISRVTVPLTMAELSCVSGLALEACVPLQGIQSRAQKRLCGFACAVLVIGLLAAMVGELSNVGAEYEARESADDRWNAFMDYCRANSGNYYVIDVYSSTSYGGASYSEKVFEDVDNSYKNFDYCGGWLAKSPLARQKLAAEGYRDVRSALLGGRGVYFVAAADRDVSWLEAFYAVRGAQVQCVGVDEILTAEGNTAFTVYRVMEDAQ